MITATRLDLMKPTIKLRCKRCNGNLAWDKEEQEYDCIQCGRIHDKNGELVRRYCYDNRETTHF